MPLKPDKVTTLNGVTVKEYLLTKHNPNGIEMPWADLPSDVLGITIHNTPVISVSGTTMAEQYTRATLNDNMGTVRVHYYVDHVEAWQNLPLTLSGYHAADGDGPGNRKTIAIECIMDGSGSANSKKAEDNCARLAAYLLNKIGKGVGSLYKHQDWYDKYCPAYIIPHWSSFKSKVETYLKALKGGTASTSTLYRIRKTWEDASSQIGAYSTLDAAKKACKSGYSVFDSAGKKVYPTSSTATTSTKSINVDYRVYTGGNWLPVVRNDTDYAGIEHRSITAFAAKASQGTLKYRVHTIGGGWLSWISKMDISDWYKGYAGISGANIDAIQIKLEGVSGYEAKYRVSSTNSTSYYDWVIGTSDYAGVFGRPIDKVQIKIVKR